MYSFVKYNSIGGEACFLGCGLYKEPLARPFYYFFLRVLIVFLLQGLVYTRIVCIVNGLDMLQPFQVSLIDDVVFVLLICICRRVAGT